MTATTIPSAGENQVHHGCLRAQHGALGVQVERTGSATTIYVREPGGTLIDEKFSTGESFYYYFDGLGSVIGLVDAGGNQRAKYTYDPFGAHATATAVNGALPSNPWRWVGGYLDATTGLYHFGERYYDPAVGRFLQTDPIMGGSCNAYVYACGDPINGTDLMGTFSCSRNTICRTARNLLLNIFGGGEQGDEGPIHCFEIETRWIDGNLFIV
ncbi:MAG: RHS repeat-associated core domain-containing protein, partial [Actinomycetota bacterium]